MGTVRRAARTTVTRRTFLEAAVGLAALPALAAAGAEEVRPGKRRMLQVNGYAMCAETPLDMLTTYLTPNDLFFVRSHWVSQAPDPRKWTLKVDGHVGSALELSLQELKAMPQTTMTCVLQCAGNGRGLMSPIVPGVQWKHGAVGNARWTGVRVRDLLDKADLKGTARHLHTFGTDSPPGKVPPFFRSLEIEKVREDGLIALEMNGEPLPTAHGAPARLVVPGWAGDHWMKWLSRLSPQPEPQKGFYMDVAYRFPDKPGEPGVAVKPEEMHPVTDLFVKSSIVDCPTKARVGRRVTLRGFAFSGAPDISKVEISADGGLTWVPAVLDREHDPWAWRLWSFAWTPAVPGKATLWARSTDSRGSVQPKEAVWNQSGYFHNAWPRAEIEVVA
jgi:DMSO/TMAO reductase YedYZ molybdopterin-dependent catalytic subunit